MKIKVTGWSPFIPTDEDHSSLPVAALEYQFTNTGSAAMDAVFSLNTKNFLKLADGKNSIKSTEHGFILSEEGTAEKPFATQMAFCVDDPGTLVDHCWFRGGWWDPLTMAWNAVKDAQIKSSEPVDKVVAAMPHQISCWSRLLTKNTMESIINHGIAVGLLPSMRCWHFGSLIIKCFGKSLFYLRMLFMQVRFLLK